jgi:hypothetical protein
MNANPSAKRSTGLHTKLATGVALCLPVVIGWLAADRIWYDGHINYWWLFSVFVCAGWGGFLLERHRVLASACLGWAVLNFALIAIVANGPAHYFKSRSSCYGNLRMLEGAKLQWALDHKKADTDTPLWKDLLGEYVHELPECPGGGVYALGPVSEPPNCTIREHREQYRPVRKGTGTNNSGSAK